MTERPSHPRAASAPTAGAPATPSSNAASAMPRAVRSPRSTRRGDVAPSVAPRALASHVAREATDAAQHKQLSVVKSLVAGEAGDAAASIEQRTASLRAMLDGVSQDDLQMLLQELRPNQALTGEKDTGNPDEELARDWRQGGYPYRHLMRRASYEREKFKLQVELLNPRGARVVALEKPSEIERGQWYFQRYVQHLPTRGEIVMFDRSWYNRAGVERVMGFCTDAEYTEFMRQAPEFERNLVRSGVHLIKFWFSVSQSEQRRRFKEREAHPLKQWKLSPIDKASLDKWDDYTRAKEGMFFETDTADAPWTVIKSDCKKRARLNAMRYVVHMLRYGKKEREHLGKLEPLIVGRAHVVYERGERPGGALL